MEFTSNQRIGEIVAGFPGASNVFKKHGIDFCCGGGRPLSAAVREKGLDEQSLLAELEQAFVSAGLRRSSGDIDWRTAPLSLLIARIVTIHHAYLKQELPLLSAFTAKIAAVHGERHAELGALHQLFHQLKAELDEHLVAEEKQLFPRIQTYELSQSREDLESALTTLEELEAEHQAAGQLLAQMREVTRGYELPADACRTYTITFQKLEELESDLFQHIHLENNILFDRLRGLAR